MTADCFAPLTASPVARFQTRMRRSSLPETSGPMDKPAQHARTRTRRSRCEVRQSYPRLPGRPPRRVHRRPPRRPLRHGLYSHARARGAACQSSSVRGPATLRVLQDKPAVILDQSRLHDLSPHCWPRRPPQSQPANSASPESPCPPSESAAGPSAAPTTTSACPWDDPPAPTRHGHSLAWKRPPSGDHDWEERFHLLDHDASRHAWLSFPAVAASSIR